MFRNLDFGRAAITPRTETSGSSLPRLFGRIVLHAEPLLSLSSPEFWYVPGGGCLHAKPPVKALTSRLGSLPRLATFHSCGPHSGGLKQVLCDPTGRGLLGAPPLFPLPLADCALYALIALNHGCNYNPLLSPMSPPSESWSLAVSWGP